MVRANIKIEKNDVTELHFRCFNVTCTDGAIIYKEPYPAIDSKDYATRFVSLNDDTIKQIDITFYRD